MCRALAAGTVHTMRTVPGDLWQLAAADATAWLVVPTNGCVKPGGALVMGAGVAAGAAVRWPHLPAVLGAAVTANGNIPAADETSRVLTWPTKPDRHVLDGREHPGWMCAARIRRPECVRGVARLVWSNAPRLVALADMLALSGPIYCPPPGCGLGGLNWADVGPHLAGVLDDRFVIVLREQVRP